MIHVEIHDGDDGTLAKVYMREAPRVGEIIWIQGKAGERIRASLRTSALTITEVAHWVGEEWSPNTHNGEPIHSICVYVEPLRPDASEPLASHAPAVSREEIEAIIDEQFEGGGGCVEGPDWDWSEREFAKVKKAAADAILSHLQKGSEGCLPTAADLEAIGAIGRKPTITKHRAANLAHIRDTVAALDAAGMSEAADTLVWSVWWRVLDRQREELLLADSNRQIEALTHD